MIYQPLTSYLIVTAQKYDFGKTSLHLSSYICLSHSGTKDLHHEIPVPACNLGGAWGDRRDLDRADDYVLPSLFLYIVEKWRNG